MRESTSDEGRMVLAPNGEAVRLGHALRASRRLRRWAAGVLLAMLQDRRRPLWPWLAVQAPVVVLGAAGIWGRSWLWGYTLAHYWQLGSIAVFVAYYVVALRQYGGWLRLNFADLEHKQVWQSLALALVLFAIYGLYTSNMGEMPREYLSQLLTVAIVAFLVWRAETLQELSDGGPP